MKGIFRMSFFERLKDFFLLNLNDYSNINIVFPIGIFFTAITAALCIFVFIYAYRRVVTVTLLKQLLRHEANDETRAKTLYSMHIKEGIVIKNLLSSRQGQLNSIVCRKGDVEMTYEQYLIASKRKGYKEEKIDFSTAEFYIPEDKLDTAKKIVEGESPSMLKASLMAVLLFVVLLCISITLPQLLEYINSAIAK
jgi:hypothetical protein